MAGDHGYDAGLVAAQPTPGAIEEPEHTEKRRVFQRAPRPVDAARAVEQGELV